MKNNKYRLEVIDHLPDEWPMEYVTTLVTTAGYIHTFGKETAFRELKTTHCKSHAMRIIKATEELMKLNKFTFIEQN